MEIIRVCNINIITRQKQTTFWGEGDGGEGQGARRQCRTRTGKRRETFS